MKTLKLADGLALPLDFATKTAAILAQRRKGKTYTASVLAEEMVAAKQPFVALDPTGAWWGLRASADGQRDGLPVVVLGGQHGDVPLERTGGKLIADLVVDEPGYYVIDFSLFESGEAERQFAVDFAERLYRAKGQPGKDFTLHLFVDEADRFVPQQMRKGSGETSPRLLGAFETIVRRGGLRGLGTTLVSQRAAVVNKNVLEMIDVLITLRTVGPNDQDAIENYIKRHGDEDVRREMMGSLAGLDIGEAWIWEPGADPPLFERARIRQRHTFNSSATPKPGEKRVEPRRLAAVDLAALQERMKATIEKAKADDPRELRKKVAELEAQLKKQPQTLTSAPVVKERPVLTDADRELLRGVQGQLVQIDVKAREIATTAEDRATRLVQSALAEYLNTTRGVGIEAAERLGTVLERVGVRKVLAKLEGASASAAVAVAPARKPVNLPDSTIRQTPPTPKQSTKPVNGNGAIGNSGLRRMLIALAQRPEGLTLKQIGVRAGMSSRSGTFSTYASRARQEGWMLDGGKGGRSTITAEGLVALGEYEPLPTGRGLYLYWLNELGDSGAGRILQAVVGAHPNTLTPEEIGERANLNPRSGTFSTYMSRLRTLELLESGRGWVKASEELVD